MARTDGGRLNLSFDSDEPWHPSLDYQGPSTHRARRIATEFGCSEPEEIVSHRAGNPAMDPDCNHCLTHHYFDAGGVKVQTDICLPPEVASNCSSTRACPLALSQPVPCQLD